MMTVVSVDAFYCGGGAVELNLLEKSSRVLRCYPFTAANNDSATTHPMTMNPIVLPIRSSSLSH